MSKDVKENLKLFAILLGTFLIGSFGLIAMAIPDQNIKGLAICILVLVIYFANKKRSCKKEVVYRDDAPIEGYYNEETDTWHNSDGSLMKVDYSFRNLKNKE